MSHTGKSVKEVGFDSLTNRFCDSLSFDNNKPDFKELDLGSPVSPLRPSSSTYNAGNNGGTTSTSSSSSSGSVSGKTNTNQLVKKPDATSKNHSGELSGLSETSPIGADAFRSGQTTRISKPGHRRSVSAGAPLIYAGGSFVSSSNNGSSNGATSVTSIANVLPSGNICRSGKILKPGMSSRSSNRTDVLGSGTGNYGHGSIVRSSAKLGSAVDGNLQFGGENATVKRVMGSVDPEEVKGAGNQVYRRGNFVEALLLYERAISISPENAAYRSNRAAALTALGRLGEAVRECEEAVRLDPGYGRAHQRLASLYLRLGQVDNARHHLHLTGQQPDVAELQKLQLLEKHLNRCTVARKIGDWKSALRETDAALAIGADSSPQLVACKAEALLKLHQLEDADTSLSNAPKLEPYPPSCLKTKFFGMLAEAYVLYVRANIEMALGRFENAVAAAEKAAQIDFSNVEIAMMLSNVKMVARARTRGNDLFTCGRYSEACAAYGEGLKYDSSNSVLYCNRAVCWSKLGLWEKSVEDCNQALRIQPNYTKALLRRAASNEKLGRWAEAVEDYEVLRRELPGDTKVSNSLHHAQVVLKNFREEEVHNKKFGGKNVSSLDKFKAAISSPGVSVVHFKAASDEQCEEISLFINKLCVRYPSVHFLKVNVEESLAVAKAENIRTVPTFKIYKNGDKVLEMIRPSPKFLEDSVRNYSL